MAKLYRNKAWLIQKYLHENMSAEKIAIICKVTPNTIYVTLREFGIARKK